MPRYTPKNMPVILGYLAIHNHANKWQIAKDMKKSYSNIHKTIKELLRIGIIKITRVQPGTKNPKIEVEYYTLTPTGLLLALCSVTEATKESVWGLIAKNYRNTCLTFKKWPLFEQKHIEHIVVKRLKDTLSFIHFLVTDVYRYLGDKEVATILTTHVTQTFDFLDEAVFALNLRVLIARFKFPEELAEDLQETQMFLSTIIEDEELRKYVLKILSKDKKILKTLSEVTNQLITTLSLET